MNHPAQAASAVILTIVLLACALMANIQPSFVPAAYATTTTQFYLVSADNGQLQSSCETYAFARNNSTATANDTTDSNVALGQTYSTGMRYVQRFFFRVDFSSIPVGASVTSAFLSLNCSSTATCGTNWNLVLQKGVNMYYPHSWNSATTNAVRQDYSKGNYTGGGGQIAVTTSGWTLNTRYALNLNTTGIGWINKTGISGFVLRSDRDILGIEPANSSRVSIYTTRQTGTLGDPALWVSAAH